MKKLFIAVSAALLFALGAANVSFAQVNPATDVVTEADVIAACSVAGNTADCTSLTTRLVAKIKATSTDPAVRRQAVNSLVVRLVQASQNNPELRTVVSSALTTVATEASDVVDQGTIETIAAAVETGDTETVTAALGAVASPN